MLDLLFTDAWAAPHTVYARLASWRFRGLRDRYRADIPSTKISHITLRYLASELARQAYRNRADPWEMILARNKWFARAVERTLQSRMESAYQKHTVAGLISYSYTALEGFEAAKRLGLKTVLVQIDPGLSDFETIKQVYQKYQRLPDMAKIPDEYWQRWRRECDLADLILVNSEWSRSCLTDADIDRRKIEVIPLAFDRTEPSTIIERSSPASYSDSRPLTALFLGNVSVRKGVLELLSAASLVKNLPIRFVVVGRAEPGLEAELNRRGNVEFVGPVARSEVHQFYASADVFVFPTHSDGFGLTQLEAQSFGLPVISSRYCGQVVENGANGLLLEQVTPTEIAKALTLLVQQPQLVHELSKQALLHAELFTQSKVSTKLEESLTNCLSRSGSTNRDSINWRV